MRIFYSKIFSRYQMKHMCRTGAAAATKVGSASPVVFPWDALLETLAPALTSSSSPSFLTPTSTSSGEFQPFVLTRSSIAASGNCKLFALLYDGHAVGVCN